MGKLDLNQCSLMDPKGENYKYNFDIEGDKLLKEMKKVEEAEKPSMKWDSGFVSSEDSVEITNIPEDVMPEEVKEWLKGRGIMLEETVTIKQSVYPGTMKMTGLDAELAEQIKNSCWGKFFGEGKRKKKIFVDLVRDKTKEAAKDTAVKADIERKKSDKEIRNEENVEDDKEEVTYPEFITDDEEAEDDGSIYTTLADKKQIDEVVNEASRMRKERIEKQIKGWNNPEGGMKRGISRRRCSHRSLKPSHQNRNFRRQNQPKQTESQKIKRSEDLEADPRLRLRHHSKDAK